MAIAGRTPSTGTWTSGQAGSITLPASVATGDILVVAVANAGTSGPATPTGWTQMVGSPWSAGSSQSISGYWAPYSVSLTLNFTNAASVAAWVCNAFFQSGSSILLDGNPVAASNSTNNTTMTTGAPTTGSIAGDYEVLAYGWTSSGTQTAASGMTRDGGGANGSSVSVSIGHNNTTSLGASTATTAFAPTLSGNNNRKTGVGILLRPVQLVGTVSSAGVASVSVSLSDKRTLGTRTSAGVATVTQALSRKRALTVSTAGVSTASGAISRKQRAVTGTSTGSSTCSGTISIAGAAPPSGIALVVHGSYESTTSNGFTTSSLDTTGASLLLVWRGVAGSGGGTVSDSKGNTWTPLPEYVDAFTDRWGRFYYAKNPIVGSGHTFTVSGSGNFPTLMVAAFSGIDPGDPFDVENGGNNGFADNVNTGSITPGADGELLIAGMVFDGAVAPTNDGGFTVIDSAIDLTFGHTNGQLAYLLQSTAAAANPKFSFSDGASRNLAAIASFRAASGGTVFVSDRFTDTDSTNIESHTPDIGGAWTREQSSAGALFIQSNHLVNNSFDRSTARNAATPPSRDYTVEADVTVVTLSSFQCESGVCARWTDTSSLKVGYRFFLRPGSTTSEWHLIGGDPGSPAFDHSATATVSAGGIYHLKLTVRDVICTAEVDGVVVLTDSSGLYTEPGYAGLHAGEGVTGNSTLDNFLATTVSEPTPFVFDTFTGADSTVLSSHTPDVGGSWVNGYTGGTSDVYISGNRLVNVNFGRQLYTNSATPPSADYSVEADLLIVDNVYGNQAGLLIRWVPGASHGYYFLLDQNASPNDAWTLMSGNEFAVNGSQSTTATYSVTNPPRSYHLKLTASGTTITAAVNGTVVLTNTDGLHTAAGVAGLWIGEGLSGQLQLDNFVAAPLVISTGPSTKNLIGTSHGVATASGTVSRIPFPMPTAAMAFTDDFNSSTLNAHWTPTGTVSTGPYLNLGLSGVSGGQSGVVATTSADLTGRYAQVQLRQRLPGTTQTSTFLLQLSGGNDGLVIDDHNGNLRASTFVASSATVLVEIAWPTGAQWLRICEVSGTIYWFYSTNGYAWTYLASAAAPWAVTALYPTLLATFTGTSSPSTAIFDNLNLAAPIPASASAGAAVASATISKIAGTAPLKHVTEDFTGSGALPDPPWHNYYNSGTRAIVKSGGLGVGQASGFDNVEYWDADTFNADQYSQAAAAFNGPGDGSKYVYLLLRASGQTSDATDTSYWFWTDGGSDTALFRQVNNVNTVLISASGVTFVSGDVFRFEAVGSTLRAFKNGTPIVWSDGHDYFIDTSITSGAPGMGGYSNVSPIDNWAGGDVPKLPRPTSNGPVFAGVASEWLSVYGSGATAPGDLGVSTAPFSFVCLIRPVTASNFQGIFGNGDGAGGSGGGGFWVGLDNTLHQYTNIGIDYVGPSSYAVQAGVWTLLVASIRDATHQDTYAYDYSLTTWSQQHFTLTRTPTAPVNNTAYIGNWMNADGTPNTEYFKGDIAWLGLWATDLSNGGATTIPASMLEFLNNGPWNRKKDLDCRFFIAFDKDLSQIHDEAGGASAAGRYAQEK